MNTIRYMLSDMASVSLMIFWTRIVFTMENERKI